MKCRVIIKSLLIALILLQLLTGCNQKKEEYLQIMHNPQLYSSVVHGLTYVVIYDIFSPPVASRIYAYSNLAAFEVLAQEGTHFASLQNKVKGLNNIPVPPANRKIDYPFASLIALLKVGKQLTFSANLIQHVTDSVKSLAVTSAMPDTIFVNSVQYGERVADSVLSWSKRDNYIETRGSGFTVSNIDGHWMPTPPGYFDAVEPLWKNIRCMVMDSANMFPPPGPAPFSTDTTSTFYKMAKEVMVTGNTMNSNQKSIANFWDCNSYTMNVKGHTKFATKAMTPPGHWMEIIGTVSKNNKSDFYKTAYAYTGASIGIFDAFICCWFTKYKYDVVRPETYINKYIDPEWRPYLQTPPFPEYNSAHSAISGAAASILAAIYINKTAFRDSSERDWGWPDRNFKNSDEAALEVSFSRFYGGIHYRNSVNDAYEQGKKIGNLVIAKLGNQ